MARTSARRVLDETCRRTVLCVAFALGTFMVPAQAAHRFANCTRMHHTYAHGVARSSSAAEEEVDDGFGMAKVSRPLYRANKSLDADDNGVACEA